MASDIDFRLGMKDVGYRFLCVIALLMVLLIGSIPFLISFIVGAVCRHRLGAYGVALITTIGITLLSFRHPEIFRFGGMDFKIHDSFYVVGVPSLIANLAKNVFFACLGVLSGRSAKEGYLNANQGNKACDEG